MHCTDLKKRPLFLIYIFKLCNCELDSFGFVHLKTFHKPFKVDRKRRKQKYKFIQYFIVKAFSSYYISSKYHFHYTFYFKRHLEHSCGGFIWLTHTHIVTAVRILFVCIYQREYRNYNTHTKQTHKLISVRVFTIDNNFLLWDFSMKLNANHAIWNSQD